MSKRKGRRKGGKKKALVHKWHSNVFAISVSGVFQERGEGKRNASFVALEATYLTKPMALRVFKRIFEALVNREGRGRRERKKKGTGPPYPGIFIFFYDLYTSLNISIMGTTFSGEEKEGEKREGGNSVTSGGFALTKSPSLENHAEILYDAAHSFWDAKSKEEEGKKNGEGKKRQLRGRSCNSKLPRSRTGLSRPLVKKEGWDDYPLPLAISPAGTLLRLTPPACFKMKGGEEKKKNPAAGIHSRLFYAIASYVGVANIYVGERRRNERKRKGKRFHVPQGFGLKVGG